MGRMVRGVDSTYEELFAYACPKFITAAPPNLDAPGSNTNQVTCSSGPVHLAVAVGEMLHLIRELIVHFNSC